MRERRACAKHTAGTPGPPHGQRSFTLFAGLRGAQISGVHWDRPSGVLGIAMAVNGLSAAHRDYLAWVAKVSDWAMAR
jgi:hypothetical protein